MHVRQAPYQLSSVPAPRVLFYLKNVRKPNRHGCERRNQGRMRRLRLEENVVRTETGVIRRGLRVPRAAEASGDSLGRSLCGLRSPVWAGLDAVRSHVWPGREARGQEGAQSKEGPGNAARGQQGTVRGSRRDVGQRGTGGRRRDRASPGQGSVFLLLWRRSAGDRSASCPAPVAWVRRDPLPGVRVAVPFAPLCQCHPAPALSSECTWPPPGAPVRHLVR